MGRKPVKNRQKTAIKRGERGRFLPGTAAGPGRPANPFARRLAGLKVAFAEAVSAQDMQALAGKLLQLALAGDIGAVKVLLAALIGPVAPVDPDELDRHELGVLRRRPTEIDELMLIVQGHQGNGRMPELPAAEEAEEDDDAPEPEPDGPDALTCWQEFAAGWLEWDTQAACPLDLLYGRYARWCAGDGLPLLSETDVLAWLRENGARLKTFINSNDTVAEGVRIRP